MRRTLIVSSVGIHIGLVLVLFAVGAWHLDRLDAGNVPDSLRVQTPPPAEAAGSPAKKRAAFERKHAPPKKETPKVVVQPVERAPEIASTVAPKSDISDLGDGNGSGSGSGSGSGPGDSSTDGPCTLDCAPPEHHDVVAQQQIIPPQLLSGLRISGETQLQPPDVVKTDMHRAGTSRVVASFQVCLDPRGNVASTRQLKPSGYAGYDAALVRGLSTWRYKPYLLNGRGIAVCSVVTFIYSMK